MTPFNHKFINYVRTGGRIKVITAGEGALHVGSMNNLIQRAEKHTRSDPIAAVLNLSLDLEESMMENEPVKVHKAEQTEVERKEKKYTGPLHCARAHIAQSDPYILSPISSFMID